jgi:hypothetical protein
VRCCRRCSFVLFYFNPPSTAITEHSSKAMPSMTQQLKILF